VKRQGADQEEAPATAAPAVECRRLTCRFGSHTAVDGIDLSVRPGEVFGLLGPNGAGKTTTIRSIITLLPVKPGCVRIFGRDAAADPMGVRRLIGYVPQLLSVDGALTGRENVTLFAELYDIPRSRRRARVDQVLASMGLDEAADRLAGTYSGGMVRRLELAQALVNTPRLLVLDEPTVGLDPIARTDLWRHVRELQAGEPRMTVLLTTHYMEEADALCDTVALMHRARIRRVGPPGELKAALGPGATLDDVFRRYTSDELDSDGQEGGMRDVRSTRRTVNRLG
jgi:ABC-2 type transport system ATP-binding protein